MILNRKDINMKKSIYSEEQSFLTKKLIEARKNSNFSQKEVAEKLERTQSYVSKVESGQLKIDVIELKKFAKLYNKRIEYFIE